MFCSALFLSIPFRPASPPQSTRHTLPEPVGAAMFCSALFLSIPFRPASPPPQSIRPTMPAATRCRNVLFCHTPFNSIPAYDHFRLTAANPCCSALFHSGLPAPPNLPDIPCRPPVGAAMLCSSRLRSIPLRLTPAYRLTAANPCRFILLCLIPASPAIPYLPPVHTAPKPIDSVHQSQPKTHTQHISPSLLRATPN